MAQHLTNHSPADVHQRKMSAKPSSMVGKAFVCHAGSGLVRQRWRGSSTCFSPQTKDGDIKLSMRFHSRTKERAILIHKSLQIGVTKHLNSRTARPGLNCRRAHTCRLVFLVTLNNRLGLTKEVMGTTRAILSNPAIIILWRSISESQRFTCDSLTPPERSSFPVSSILSSLQLFLPDASERRFLHCTLLHSPSVSCYM